jgi:hypothetical protein
MEWTGLKDYRMYLQRKFGLLPITHRIRGYEYTGGFILKNSCQKGGIRRFQSTNGYHNGYEAVKKKGHVFINGVCQKCGKMEE